MAPSRGHEHGHSRAKESPTFDSSETFGSVGGNHSNVNETLNERAPDDLAE